PITAVERKRNPHPLAVVAANLKASSPLPAAVRLPCSTSRRQVNNWFGATPCRRATRLTVIPGSKVSSTMRTLSGGLPAPTTLNRRDDLNAIGKIGHRHGCMPHTCQVGDRVRSVRGLSHELVCHGEVLNRQANAILAPVIICPTMFRRGTTPR